MVDLLARRREMLGKAARLPKEYQEVKWIGTKVGEAPYILTNYYTGNSPSAEFKFELTGSGTGDKAVFGWLGEGYEQGFYFDLYSTVQAVYSANIMKTWRDVTRLTSQVYVCTMDADKMIINGIQYSPNNNGLYNDARRMSLFGATNANNNVVRWNTTAKAIRIYYLRIYNSEILEANFIPCYRKSDGEIGMYDTVSDTFYTNAGTGTFLKGANV